ncbi:hypothetical protein XarbCFBP8132_11895 [Xanthomonas arboricola]|uniref:Hachiman antiphage defense system protein HamA n=1 Tax=Xanthomonas arboricola TaxID=56448 RepID=UPI000CEEED5A|nr:Hachiman antiphage defense system protein HamA [Xanthomonas arboricola]PPT41772.1 hypothetical protein XarbCFBP8132_11895 [Xanthomonas arboricola]
MDELGFDFIDAVPWFGHDKEHPYVLVQVSAQSAAEFSARIGEPLRRCYITDIELNAAAQMHGVTRSEILNSKLPNAGSTMSGDFGEVLGYFYQATRELPAVTFGPKKWRLKQDRTQPSPKSDVVHFVMPNRPHSSDADAILCAEVKAKATRAPSAPIADAIRDCKKDRTSRLASTLVWLRERALTTSLGDVDVPLLDRFINAVEHPPVAKRFRAVAVICTSFLNDELVAAPSVADPDFTLVVIGVPNLHATYTAAFAAAQNSV